MIATTEDLRRNLHAIQHALVGLRHTGGGDDVLLMDEILRLEDSQKAIQAVLEARRALRLQPVVSLLAWREGSLAAPPFAARRRGVTLAEHLRNNAAE